MADHELVTAEEIEWTVEQNEDNNGEEVETQEGPVFVAMQPGVDIPAGVEVQEVVIVAEGSVSVQEVGQTVETQPNSVTVPVQSVQEIVPQVREAPKIRIKKRSLGQYVANNSFVPSNKPSPFRGRPKGSKNTNYKSSSYYGRPSPLAVPRAPAMQIKQESQSSSDSSESSDEEEEEGGPPPRKKPKPREFAHRLQWRNKDMLDAMKAVEEKKYTIRGAAKKFAVPYSTLKDRVHGRVRHGTKPGVKTVLSPEEEEELVRFVKDMESAGFHIKCMDVRDRAAEMLRLNHGHNSPYKEGSPGHNWLAGFLKRHPGLEFKRSVNRNVVPSLTKQKQMVRRFYEIASQIYKKYKMSHRSDRIFAVSELRLTGAIDATILYAAAADGSLVPPFVIFRGRALKLTSARQAFPEAFFTCCYDGRVNEDSFLWWYRDHFMKHTASNTRPTVLYIGRSIQDITIQLVQHAKEERVHLISIPRGVQHLLQPLDNEVNDNLGNMITKRIKKWEEENPGTAYSQKVIAQILSKVWKKVNADDIVTKFTRTGLFPLNVHAVTNERIVTQSHLLRESYNREYQEQAEASQGGPLSGLNLLSALSSHEYASLEQIYPGNGASQSPYGEQESDNSHSGNHDLLQQTPTGRPGRTMSQHSGGKMLLKRTGNSFEQGIDIGLEGGEMVEEDAVVEQDIIEEAVVDLPGGVVSEEMVAQEIIPTEDDVKTILANQQQLDALRRGRPRPNTDLLTRSTDVQSEIAAARSKESINKAIDSILQMEQGHVDGENTLEEVPVPITNIKQEPVQRHIVVRSVSSAQPARVASPQVTTLRLVDGKLVGSDGQAVELSSLGGGMQIQIKINKEEEEEEEIDPGAADMAELQENIVQEEEVNTQYVQDVKQLEDGLFVQSAGQVDSGQIVFQEEGTEVEGQEYEEGGEIVNSNLTSEQINELISSGMIQGVDSSSLAASGAVQQEEGGEFIQVYESAELPQQILQAEADAGEQQTIVLDQQQLQQLLLEGGEVLTEEQVLQEQEAADQPMVEYVQLADGTIQEVIME